MLSEIQYAFLPAFYLLLVIPLIVFFYLELYRYRRKVIKEAGDPHLISQMTQKPSKTKRFVINSMLVFSWFFATIALSQPSGNPHYLREGSYRKSSEISLTKKNKTHQILFLIDTSLSMTVRDTRKRISRFEQAKEIIDNTISKMRGEMVSIYAFTSELIPIVPATSDYLFARLMIRNIDINEGNTAGTNLTEILKNLKSYFDNDPKEQKTTIVLLTDGDDTEMADVNQSVRDKIKKEIKSAVDQLSENNIQFLTVGIGSEKGDFIPNFTFEGRKIYSKLDTSILQSISKKGGGEHFFSHEETPFGLATELLAKSRESNQKNEDTSIQIKPTRLVEFDPLIYDLYYKYPLAFAIVFLAVALLINERKK